MINHEIKFLTCDDSVIVKNDDFKTFKYESKKKSEESVYDQAKRSYCERRGGKWRVPKPRLLRELESKLRDRSVVLCEWLSETIVVIVFSSGSIAYLTVNSDTLDLTQILFDRYCIGKLSGQSVTGVVFSSTHILFTHTDCSATLISFAKVVPLGVLSRISDRNPHVQNINLADGARRAERKVSWSTPHHQSAAPAPGPRVLVWTEAGAEPAPWSPAAEVRANLYLYQLHGQHMNVVAFHQLENETLLAEVLRTHSNIVHIVEQTTCHKNGVTLVWLRFDIPTVEEGVVRLSAHRAGETRASLPAVARAATRSACGRRLVASCIDGTLHLVQQGAGLTHSVRAAFIPSEVSWCGSLLVAAEEGARVQSFDRALAHDHAACVHLAHHFRDPPRMKVLSTVGIRGGALLLSAFSGGTLALQRLTHPMLPLGWIRSGRMSRAVAYLQAMDWEHEPDECLYAFQRITLSAYRHRLDGACSGAVQAAVGAALASPSAARAARRFHTQLLRHGRLEKALHLAIDINSWDVFIDTKWAASHAGRADLRDEAAELALQVRTNTESECSTDCSCCSSTCSQSSRSTSPETQPPPLPRVQTVPVPLPRVQTVPVPLHQPEPTSTNSIRPNLHQYLERDLTIWNTEVKQPKPKVKWRSMDNMLDESQGISRVRSLMTIDERPNWMASVIDGVPRFDDKMATLNYNNLYQRELKETANTMYRHQNMFPGSERGKERVRGGAKNVKFSDTVTIAVVSEAPPGPSPARELAESLPLCAPHNYLAAFEPAAAAESPTQPLPPKIKVVHFGMV